MVVHIPDALEIVVISSDDGVIPDLDKDLEEDPEFEEHKIDHEVEEAESTASNSSFNSGEVPEDEFDPDNNPYRDRSFGLGDEFLDRSVIFSAPCVYTTVSRIDIFCAGYVIVYS